MVLPLFLLVVCSLSLSSGQITPPPQIGDKPVISDNRIWYLNHIPERCRPPIIDRFVGGGVIKDSRALILRDSPHIIRGNIEIAPSGCLYIEPGCVLKFAPGMGIIVNGTLIARGSIDPGGRITMTKAEGQDLGHPSGNWQNDARLSMGNTTRDGRLDLNFKYKWRAMCTNYNNFSAIDANVTCRHLGFLKGNFTYHSFARNLTDYILWEKPDCRGGENSLFDCPGAVNMQIGRHICDGQEVVGFQCEGLRPGLALDHWRGIDFYNSSTEARYTILGNNRVYMNVSLSFLEYLDISYTGLDTFHGYTSDPEVFYQKAAISASPHVPMINNVTIRYGAYDGLNFTEIVGPIHIANSTISQNRGYGMFIQSSVGRTLVNMTEVDHNWGDGIKFYISNLTIFDFRTKFKPENSMCMQVNTEDVTYPFFQHMDLVQVNGNDLTMVSVGGYCERSYATASNMKITVHFMIMERDPDANGTLTFRDGGELGKRTDFPIYNGSFPESFTTRTNRLFVRFQYSQPTNKICKTFPPCIRFLLEFTSNYDVDEEFRLIMSNVHDNIGYGVNIQDMRSKIRISNETVISNNQFGAGVHIYKGAGEIVINGTRIEKNVDSGINITYSGGYQLINNTELIGNKGYGIITEYMRLNRTRIESRLYVEIVRAMFIENQLIGLRMGNYCRGGEILVNESYFALNYDEAFEYLSCNISTMYKTKLKIAFNKFDNNYRHAIFMRPLLNTDGLITNNTFVNHTLATFRIDNGYDLLISRWYRDFPVSMNIFENVFIENTGRYVVNLRLTQNSAVQNMDCKFNYFQRNEINDSFLYVNPRGRANAVIVLSSTNIRLMRNHIDNPGSIRELSTHLADPSIVINARENYWGTEINKQSDYKEVYMSIFDQDDRYNLAKIEYHPALRTLRLYDNYLSDDVAQYVWEFQRGDTIGGVLENSFTVGRGKTYYVDRDIYVFKDKSLVLEPDSKLKFSPSVGIVVHGLLKADGIKLESPVIFNISDKEEFVPMENRTTSIRLVEGEDEFEGRLEVEINGQWGTVCRDGWIEENSLLVCQQLGLALNRDYPLAKMQRRAPSNTPVLMSWVSCDETDVDFTKCRSVNDDAYTCSHDKDVYIKCFRPTWAGVTLAAAYRHDQNQPLQVESQIRHLKLFNAGLLDPDSGILTPAIRIDYNYYQISYLTVQNSMSDGVYVSYNHPYSLNKMEYLTVTDNAGNGVVTKSPRLEVMHSKVDRNLKAGFLYDPYFTEYDVLLIRNMIYPDRRINMFAQPQRILNIDQIMFLICPSGNSIEMKEYIVEIRGSSSSYKLSLQVLDYLPVESSEKVIVYDSPISGITSPNTKRWEIEKDLVDFPIISSASVLTIQLKVNGQLSGRLAFAVICRNYDSLAPVLRTAVTNTSFTGNNQGIVTKHYNSPSNRRLELFHRHVLEELYFKDLKVISSVKQAMHMPSQTKFTEDYIPTYEDMTRAERVAVIVYTVFQSIFTNNNYGILAEHNHVDFANNVWQWTIDHVTIQGTQAGGLEIEVPRVNDETERQTHAAHVVDSVFKNNLNFAFTISGYYANVNIDRNSFTDNVCLLGLVSLTGMEKNLTMNSNSISNNVGRYMVDMDIFSHSEYYTEIKGKMDLNSITNNRYEGVEPPGAAYSPKTYAVAVRGLQNLSGNLNIFNNPQLGYEYVAGITALSLGNSMDLTLNYWGVTDQSSIRRRIFDFDDWNNYVIADYFPYLTVPDPNGIPSTGIREENYLDPNHLGGRVEKSQILMEIGKTYIVKSDLTIMPGITLTIPAGTELQFMPNVGILVLGRLVANGLPFARIKMGPYQPITAGRKKRELIPLEREERDSTATQNIRLRGDGTLFKDAGFLELYNASTRTWNMMCDSQFHERTAEVVCRELKKETINVKVRFTYLYDYYIYGKPQYFRKEFWYNIYNCRGDETSLSQCITRYNYNLLPCVYAANYTFITCGDRNLEPQLDYWGNIRFATDSFEEKPLESDIGIDRSSMTYVDIEGAGMLHGEKVGAIQTTYTTPVFENVNITKCAENGYDIIAPRQDLNLQLQNISGNLGFGVNVLVLNGESSNRRSSFMPSGLNTMPYNVYGLVDACRLEKVIEVKTRVILFYKYGPQMRDCVKIFSMKSNTEINQGFKFLHLSSRKTIGLRFLQINLFQEDFSRNLIEIFDGTEVGQKTLIGSIMSNSSNADIQRLYATSSNTMAVHVHASVSYGTYGFIAEVLKLPLSGLTSPNSEYTHRVQNAEIRKNEDGAIQYKNVGETTPNLFIEHCYISENGFPILNLTSPPSIDLSLQSTISFRFSHNQVSYNHGGMYIFAHTSTINTALKGNMTNNVFAFGKNGEALNISGHYFQRLMLHQNYIYNYTAGDFRDVIHIKDVVVNLTHNYILRNVGHYIIHTYNNDDSTESQLFSRNGIYNNNATALRETTIKIGLGRPKFINNYLVNTLNDFEMETYPKSMLDDGSIDAKNNWWGSERTAYISGKTYDFSDEDRLVEVNFIPPIIDNRSLVEGDCLPGWVLDKQRCYRYMGGALPYDKAKEFCLLHGAFLAEARDREGFFNYLLRLMVIDQTWIQRVWVMSETGGGRCAAFENSYLVYEQDCTRKYYPFICETDPQVTAPEELTSAIMAMIIGISVGVGGVIIIIIVIVAILMCIKSKRREKERFERTASIRSSLNNLNKINSSLRGTKSNLTALSGAMSRTRLDEFDDRSVDYSDTKHSQSSAVSDDVAESVSSGYAPEPRIVIPTATQQRDYGGRPTAAAAQQQRYNANRPLAPAPAQQRDNGRPVHSLRPDRSKPLAKPQNVVKGAEGGRQTLEQDRRKKEDDRRRYKKEEDEESSGSVDKEDFDSDSTFDEEEDEKEEKDIRNRGTKDEKDGRNTLNRANGRLVQKAVTPNKPGAGRYNKDESGDSDSSAQNSNSSRSVSSFTDPIVTPSKNIFPPRSTSKDNITDPKNPKVVHEPLKLLPVPMARPKPAPPMRPRIDEMRQPLVPNNGRASPASSEASSQASQPVSGSAPAEKLSNRLYTNEPGPQQPVYDPVYNSSSHLYKNTGASSQGSNRGPFYDPVYSGTPSDRSRSTDRYEPIEYSPTAAYGVDQAPDTDYMPRPMGSAALNRSLDRLVDPAAKPNNFRRPLVSDIDSYTPSQQSDAAFGHRQPQSAASNPRLDESLPPKPGASSSSDRSYQNIPRGSRDHLNTLPRPPPYSETTSYADSRSRSRDRLDLSGAPSAQQFRGSRENLDENPPPYSPGSNISIRPSGNVLYLNQGSRPKKHESVETEI